MNLFKRFTAEGKQDAISPTYCAAKWFEGTILLHKGATASCHHTPLTPIGTDLTTPSNIFNSPRKIADREEMLEGKKPVGCNYCWTIEDNGGLSDRRVKSKSLLNKVKWHKKTDITSTPVELEIAFDRTCNLSCAYCGPTFSSKWANEIKSIGPYKNLITEKRYNDPGESIDDENNPYINAFYSWWPELSKTLRVLRITGGEPLMSPNFWTFINFLNTKKFDGELHINTNLINHKGEVDKLINQTKNFKVKIHTSLESSFKQAEYVRAGFEETTWLQNVRTIMNKTNWVLNVTTAVSNLTVFSYLDYLKIMAALKQQYGNKRIEITCNFVNYPVFMRIDLIPRHRRFDAAFEVRLWLMDNSSCLNKHELEQVQRFMTIVGESEQAMNDTHFKLNDAISDLKNFVEQYDTRKGKKYTRLDPRFVEWYESI